MLYETFANSYTLCFKMRSELERTLDMIPLDAFEYVECAGLHGTYDDGCESDSFRALRPQWERR